jgi:hypothetical protein
MENKDGTGRSLATGLGWFSIGLGVAQLAMPDRVNRLIGVHPTEANRDLQRLIGAREIAAGVGLLATDQRPGFLWARVAGDAMDLALLGRALMAESDTPRAAMATAAVAGVTALDIRAGGRRRAAAA